MAAEGLFLQLCTKFRIDPKIGQYLADEGCETLDEFAQFLTKEDQVEALITSKIRDLDHAPLNAARIRMAWDACKRASFQADVVKRKGAEDPDFETLLPQQT